MLRVAVLAACVAGTFAAAGTSWDRCDATRGPAHWNTDGAPLCAGTQQSPIDVCGGLEHADVTVEKLVFSAEYDVPKDVHLKSKGEVYIDAGKVGDLAGLKLLMTAGQLAQIVGRSTLAAADQWMLAQAHFHWGRNKYEGSEHYIEGQQYPLELHFVHVNKKYVTADGDADIGAALASSDTDALLVIGQMFDVGTTGFIEPAAFTAMTADTVWGKSSVPTTSPDTGIKISMKLSELMDTSDGFYTYAGSLTTPTCNPVVTWVVLKKVLFIKASTMTLFRDMFQKTGDVKVSHDGNFRPLQALNGRTVYRTAGAKVDCTAGGTREPIFACPLVAAVAPAAANTTAHEVHVEEEEDKTIKPIREATLAFAILGALAAFVAAVKVLTMSAPTSAASFIPPSPSSQLEKPPTVTSTVQIPTQPVPQIINMPMYGGRGFSAA